MDLLEKIRARTARIGVIGLGYVGLPLVIEFCNVSPCFLCDLAERNGVSENIRV